MFRILVQKELKTIIQSPKFVTTFLTCSILILLSVYVGIQDYNYSLNKYIAAQNLVKNEMETASAWSELENKIYRKPNPLQIFSAGINNDLGRFSLVARFKDVKLESSSYSEDPIFAFFRYLDFTFIVTIVLSLFAILFTYDSVNGEKESGTLKLVFSNSIPRSKFLGAKFLGSWLGLIIPVSIPVLISILFLLLFNISLTSPQWMTLILYIITSFGYFTFFIALGIMFSSFTKTSSSSFLISLVAWISFVFIIPRIGTMLAGQFVDIPSIAEIESMKDSFSKAKLNEQFEKIEQLKLKRENEMQGMSESEKEIYKEEKEWEWMKEESAITKEMRDAAALYSNKLNEEVRNKKNKMERLALALSRFSPASSFQLASMNMMQTDIDLRNRIEDNLKEYKNSFVDFINEKENNSGSSPGGIRVSISSWTGVQVEDKRGKDKLNFTELPVFTEPQLSFANIIQPAVIDIGLIVVYIFVSFGISFAAFLKFDLR